jgi:hypothetical protein
MKTIVVMLLTITTATAQEDRSWHFLSQTYGGTISLLKDLTKHECDFLYARAYHQPTTDEEKEAAELLRQRQKVAKDKCFATPGIVSIECSYSPQAYMVTSGDIKSAECFQ